MDELIKVLGQEIELYDEILKISKNKTQVIVEGKVNELEKIIKTEQSLILSISKFENQREILINKISKVIGQKSEDVTLTVLIGQANKEQSEKLKIQQEALGNIIKELGSVNQLNTQLIKSSLEYINFSLNIFASVENPDNNYSLDGEKPNVKAKSMLDIKI